MQVVDDLGRGDAVEALARGAVEWMVEASSASELDVSLYYGWSGVLVALVEAADHFGEPRYADAAQRAADVVAAQVEVADDYSLYFGLAGMPGALQVAGRGRAAGRALERVRMGFDGVRWNEMFELLAANAGIGLGVLWSGDVELAVMAVNPYAATADRTTGGVNWPVRPSPPRSHQLAHGTLGIVYALAAVGHAAGRDDLIELALAGARDVISRNEAGPEGFLVPHSDPPHRPELIERYSFGWCNGPAGDAQVFRLLAIVTGDTMWAGLADACWHTVTTSGLPGRLRPGFWDNDGRCCGTAGVLALACDRIVERGDDFSFASVLVEALADHAATDTFGSRWSNVEHRASQPDLPPQPGWAMGNAGIVRELLRYVRVRRGGSAEYAVQWPDHPDARCLPGSLSK
ncbi:lanthionine synthetase LanC family protein [uncultured Jatrophihabitans sp.]|uniref:lanthionine synthetase LanC family protein n=1 Tax=uncultured Jatrophihabitans sp. TaxID=1610747 RepID=UPI0035CA9B3A